MSRPLPRLAAIAIALALTGGAAVAGPHDDDILAIAEASVEPWSRILSCTIISEAHGFVMPRWIEDLAELTEVLAEGDVDPAVAEQVLKLLAPEAMLAPTRGSAADFIAFCNADPQWERSYQLLRVPLPVLEIDRLLND